MSKKDATVNSMAMGPRALEMVMRDVLGGMEDVALLKCLESHSDVFQVMSIDQDLTNEQPQPASSTILTKAELIELSGYRKN
ncbi:MAG TPA: hypothetical protein ENI64_10745 [Gammaproteobacteria bacterium]|nr:hypothetical protein [Gammaproteobacteria bacterium]